MSNYYSKDDNAILEIDLKALSKNYKNLLKDEFAYDNEILDKTFHLGLKKLGYY